jgi:hypothetical protein
MKAEKKESEMSERPTPETDAACGHASNWDSLQGKLREEVPAEFARRLERERDEARRQCLQWLEEWHLTDRARCDMKSERDEARERYNELLGVEVTK